jgi:hypothetical protein
MALLLLYNIKKEVSNMMDLVRKVAYFAMEVPNRPGGS